MKAITTRRDWIARYFNSDDEEIHQEYFTDLPEGEAYNQALALIPLTDECERVTLQPTKKHNV